MFVTCHYHVISVIIMSLHCSCDILSRCCMLMSPACTLCVVLCCQDGDDVTCLYSVCCVVRMEMMSPACTLCVVLCCQDGDDVTCLYSVCCVVLSGWR